MITHDRWQRIKEIFQSAQERTPAERFDFLNEVCGGDQSLRDEVEALLTADDTNEDFLSAPAYEFAAGMLSDEAAEFSAGQKVGRYTILCPLGAGGMGQIYLADDTQLGRKIALKLIAREFATDPRRVLRFEQEARAASALNHPNVCVIHDIGVTGNNRHFIAMEYIQGVTLRDKLAHDVMTPLEALQIAGQVAAALAVAHAAGIVHRDIKPENIMLRPDGYVKVLDFGLAKLTEMLPEEPLGVDTTVSNINASTKVRTEAGTLMGTVKYMSPEQLREGEVDERTDIWSLGVVLYEMLTRTTPFETKTPNGTIALIAGPQSAELSLSPELPVAYRDLIRKTLEKDRAKRYQSITRLAADLNTLQKELEREFESGLVKPPLPSYPAALDGQKTRDLFANSAFLTRMRSQALSTAEFIISEIRTHKTAALFTGATSVLVLLILIPTASRFTNNGGDGQQASRAAPVLTTKPLTTAGTSSSPAISPDGKQVAHAEEQNEKQKLMLTSTVTAGAPLEIVPPADVRYIGLTFSRDGNYLYFTRTEKSPWGILYRLALAGGVPVQLSEHVDSPVTFSPNGDQFAFVRLDREKGEYLLMVANVDGTNERVLAKRNGSSTFSTYGLSWSPDGTTIVCSAGRWDYSFHHDLIAVEVDSGQERPIGAKSWSSIYQIAWKDDMSGLVFSARQEMMGPHQLWSITYPGGVAEKLTTSSLTEHRGVSLAGNKIVTVETSWNWETWIATLDGSAGATSINSGQGLTYGITWTPMNKIVFSAMVQDRLNLSRIDLNGSNLVPLTDAGDNFNPSASTDGRFIVFLSTRNNTFDIYRLNMNDVSEVTRLTYWDRTGYPSISPDNQWVAFDVNIDGPRTIWKVPLAGGQPVKVADRYRMPVFSPNSRLIVARYEPKSGTQDSAIFSVEGGPALAHVPIPEMEWQRVYWLDERTLTFIKNSGGTSNIWSYDLLTNELKQLTNFSGDQIFAYALSPNHKQVACQRGRKITTVIMMSSER